MIGSLAEAVAMMFGLGLAGPMRGPLTMAAMLAAMHVLRSNRMVAALMAFAVCASGGAAAHFADRLHAVTDDGRIVVDEAAGVSVMMALAMPRGWRGATALGFAFWALDNLKPWPIWWIEEWPGAMGIMGDDIAAGAFIALVYLVVRRVYERQAFRRPPKG